MNNRITMTPIRYYTDVHIGREVAHQLRQKGVDIVHLGSIIITIAEKYAVNSNLVFMNAVMSVHSPAFLRMARIESMLTSMW